MTRLSGLISSPVVMLGKAPANTVLGFSKHSERPSQTSGCSVPIFLYVFWLPQVPNSAMFPKKIPVPWLPLPMPWDARYMRDTKAVTAAATDEDALLLGWVQGGHITGALPA